MKRILALIFCSMLLLPTLLQDLHAASQFVPANDPNIRYQGRWDFSDSLNPTHSWPGAVIYFRFTGHSIGIRTNDNAAYYNVNIDGKSHGIFHGNKQGQADYMLAEKLPGKQHLLRLSLRNFTFDTVYAFSGFLIDEGAKVFPAPKAPKLKIEFIGDSYTSSEGNEVKEERIEWSKTFPLTNIDEGYAAVLAKHYNAEYHISSRSGIGLVCDWTGKRDIAMSKFFDRTLLEKETPKWNFASWQPDLVVVALGLNDFSGLKGKDTTVSVENSELYRKAYHAFMDTLRKDYPGVKILVVAAYTDWIRANLKQVVDEEQAAGKKDISYAQYDYFTGGYVANNHPTVATHHKMAKQLISQIDKLKLLPTKK